jgi:hypothetical protein
MVKPADGTLQIPAYRRLKARKALEREVRRIKFRLYLQYFSLRFQQFCAEATCARLRLQSMLFGYR